MQVKVVPPVLGLLGAHSPQRSECCPSLLGTWKSSGQSAEFPFLLGKLEDLTRVLGFFFFLTILPSPATCVSQYPRDTLPLTH